MYAPSLHDITRSDLLLGLIASHPLGTVVTHAGGELCADHIPFEVAPPTDQAPHGILRAHVARANPLWRCGGSTVLTIFQGPSAYISPSLYEEKAVSGKVVPTYNYAVVHAHGVLRAIEDPAWLLALLGRLTAQHESSMAAPWAVGDAPRDYLDKLMAQIVGIEIPIGRIQGKWKVSQNKPARDQQNIAAQVPGMAGLMASVRT